LRERPSNRLRIIFILLFVIPGGRPGIYSHKIPNSKFQVPNKFKIENSNVLYFANYYLFMICYFVFIIYYSFIMIYFSSENKLKRLCLSPVCFAQ
jgi:hypothetical protein